jgi:hypothetical protein
MSDLYAKIKKNLRHIIDLNLLAKIMQPVTSCDFLAPRPCIFRREKNKHGEDQVR